MGVAIPQVITEDKAGGALVIDGSLQLSNPKNQYLSRTPSSAGNLRTWTLSFWHKTDGNTSISNKTFAAQSGSSIHYLEFASQKIDVGYYTGSHSFNVVTTQVFRDPSAWYHIVLVFDTNNGTTTDRVRIFVNGSRVTDFSTSNFPTSGFDGLINSTNAHAVGGTPPGSYFATMSAKLSQVYLIDGQALDPSYFGYTDSLTNTWRPKKLSSSVAFGTNGFYLPLDGNTPIGQDQSGRGNNWTPVNFGGSNTIEKATGALPILNTDGGGKVARVGVRTDSAVGAGVTCVLALPLVGIRSDFSNKINGGTTEKVVTANGNAAGISTISNFYGGSFYFDGTGDYLQLDPSGSVVNTLDSWMLSSGSKIGTFECWVYPTAIKTPTTNYDHSSVYNRGTTYINWGIRPGGTVRFYWYQDAETYVDSTITIPLNQWSHIAVTIDGSTVRHWINGVSAGSGSYSFMTQDVGSNPTVRTIGVAYGQSDGHFTGYIQDFRIYNGVAKYTQNFIPASTDPDILPDTPSGVAYSSNVALVPSTDGAVAFDGSGDWLYTTTSSDFDLSSGDWTIEFFVYPMSNSQNTFLSLNAGSTGGINLWRNTSQQIVIDDGQNPQSASSETMPLNMWHHLTAVRSSGTTRIYLNGKLILTNTFSPITSDRVYIGVYNPASPSFAFTGFISNLQVVKGTALYTSNFTPPTAPISSVANTKLLCCKSNSSATAFDVSPGTITANGNAVATNFNPFTVNINTQRGQESGYATFNPLDANSSGTLSNGNLQWASAANAHYSVRSTLSMKTGKWYAEGTVLVNTNNVGSAFGIALRTASLSSYTGDTGSWSYHCNGNKYLNGDGGSSFGTAYGTTVGNVVGLAFDADNGNLDAYCNGVYQGRVVSGLSSNDYFWMVNAYNWTWGINFGQKPFKFPPPAGFQPLALANTPRPTIVRPYQYVGIVTYSGDGTTEARAITVGWKPDFVWIKGRNTAYSHLLYDTVRGVGPLKGLNSNETRAEGATVGDDATYGYLSSFNNNGFSVIKGSDATSYTNGGSSNYVAWAWKAGGNSNTYNINDVGYATTTAAGLTAGNSNLVTGASVNTKSGFSIITYSSSTTPNIPHGLGRNVSFIIAKSRTVGVDWVVYHRSLGKDKALVLNGTGGELSISNYWGTSEPNDTVFGTYGTGSNSNNQGNMVAYCWAEIFGFSKFGTYTGNLSADGPMVVTGFRPRWIILKNVTSSGNYPWFILDAERGIYNGSNSNFLLANTSEQENYYAGSSSPGLIIDMLSNGFKIRSNGTTVNNSGATYIYCAFAETPSFNLYGGQANAR